MTDDRLEEIRAMTRRDVSNALHSGCDDYACYCHFALPEAVAEIDRLRAGLKQMADGAYLNPMANEEYAARLLAGDRPEDIKL